MSCRSQPRPLGRLRAVARVPGERNASAAADRGARSALEALLGGAARHLPRRALVGWAPRAVITLPLGVLPVAAGALHAQAFVSRSTSSSPARWCAWPWRSAMPSGRSSIRASLSSIRRDAPFPTFWTPLPMHAPLAHCVGGRSEGRAPDRLFGEELVDAGAGERAERTRECRRAFRLLRFTTGRPTRIARGGYSYVRVGGTGAREELAAPLEETLYLRRRSDRHGAVGNGRRRTGQWPARRAGTAERYCGSTTLSMTWITPFDAMTSVLMTRALSTITAPPSVRTLSD